MQSLIPNWDTSSCTNHSLQGICLHLPQKKCSRTFTFQNVRSNSFYTFNKRSMVMTQEGSSYVEYQECEIKFYANECASQNEKPRSLHTLSLSLPFNNKNKKKIASALKRRTMRGNTIGKYFHRMLHAWNECQYKYH